MRNSCWYPGEIFASKDIGKEGRKDEAGMARFSARIYMHPEVRGRLLDVTYYCLHTVKGQVRRAGGFDSSTESIFAIRNVWTYIGG